MLDSLGAILVAAAVVGLWVVAIVFGRDTRDGRDWLARTNLRDRPPRIGD